MTVTGSKMPIKELNVSPSFLRSSTIAFAYFFEKGVSYLWSLDKEKIESSLDFAGLTSFF